MKRDLVYIVGKSSGWGDNELRYSLRSVAERMADVGTVFIVGELPPFVDPKSVAHVPMADPTKDKTLNALAKIRRAAEDPRMSAEFVLMNDDFVVLRKGGPPRRYSSGSMKAKIGRHKKGVYRDALIRTAEMLKGGARGEVLDYEMHCPVVFDKEALIDVMDEFRGREPYLVRTAYGHRTANDDAAPVPDFKAFSMEKVRAIAKRNLYLSSSKEVEKNPEYRAWLRAKFPVRCRFEMLAPERRVATAAFSYGGREWAHGDVVDAPLPKVVRDANTRISRPEREARPDGDN